MKLRQICENVSGVQIPVFRGISRGPTDGQSVVTLPVRTDRRPLEMSIPFSAFFNYAFEEKFGVPNIRKACVFGSTDVNTAQEYASNSAGGAVVVLTVPAQAKLFFNPSIEDSLFYEDGGDLGEALSEFIQELGDAYVSLNEDGDYDQFFEDVGLEDVGNYMSMTGTAYYQNVLQSAVGQDAAKLSEFTNRLKKLAGTLTSGYQAMSPAQFASKYSTNGEDFFEVIIAGITSYQGTVAEISDDDYY